MNLLDTPGHADFSEDTYRTLHAVDGAVMLLDCAKGVEPQTKKLFRVCKQRADADLHLRQQDGPPGARSVRPHRRGRERPRHRRLPDHLAHLPRGHVPRRLPPRDAAGVPLRSGARRIERRDRRRGGRGRSSRLDDPRVLETIGEAALRAAPRGGRAPRRRGRRASTRASSSPARSRRCSSAAPSTTSASQRSSTRSASSCRRPAPRARPTAGSVDPTTSASAASSSRSRRTWTARTAIASRSCASAPGASSAA